MKLQKGLRLLFLGYIVSLLCLLEVCAQSTDSSYIKNFEKHWRFKTSLYNNIFDVEIRRPEASEGIIYSSNNPLNLGVGIAHPKIPVEIAFGYSINIGTEEEFIKTKSIDLQVHKYGRKFLLDVFFQDYKGFHIEDNDTQLTFDDVNFPALSALEVGVIGQYIFNEKKFSYKAAFNQSEQQVQSAGSFLLGGGVYYFDIHAGEDSLVLYGQPKVKSYQVGFNLGYAYNWVIRQEWLLNGSLTLGANLGNEGINTFFDSNLSLNPTALIRIAVVYDEKKWAMSLSGLLNAIELTHNESLDSQLRFGRFMLTYVRRFYYK